MARTTVVAAAVAMAAIKKWSGCSMRQCLVSLLNVEDKSFNGSDKGCQTNPNREVSNRISLNATPTIIQPIALLANTMTSKQQEARKDGYLLPSQNNGYSRNNTRDINPIDK